MFVKSKKTLLSVIIFIIVSVSTILCSLLAVDFSSIYYILIGALVGLFIYLITCAAKKLKKNVSKDSESKED